MASTAWGVGLADGQHRVEARFGYWWPRLRLRVDGRPLSTRRAWWSMATRLGFDQPVAIGPDTVTVQVRPILRSVIVMGYRLGIVINGQPVEGLAALPEPTSAPGLSKTAGARIDRGAAAAIVGSSIALLRTDNLLALALFIPVLGAIHLIGKHDDYPAVVRVATAVSVALAWLIAAVAIAAFLRGPTSH